MIPTNSATEGGMVVLLAESNARKALSIQSNFERLHLLERLVQVTAGHDVLNYLHGDDIYSDRLNYPVPNLLLLSQKLPDLSGVAVLCCLRSEIRFQHMPVVMLGSSFTQAQVATVNWMRAACFRHRDATEGLMQAIARGRYLASCPERGREASPQVLSLEQRRRDSDEMMAVGLS